MARMFMFMFGMVGICIVAVVIAGLSEKVNSNQRAKKVRAKDLERQLEQSKTTTTALLNQLNALDKAAQSEYAVNSTNIFAASVSDTIERFKKKRSLT